MNLKFWKKLKLTDDLRCVDRIILGIAEFFGTAILMFVGCMGCVFNILQQPRSILEGGFSFGFGVLIAIQCFGHISGAHINPIITVAAFISGELPLLEVPIYFIGQFFGSLAGFSIVRALVPNKIIFFGNVKEGICAVGIHPDFTVTQGLCLEIVISFLLVTCACGIWDSRTPKDSIPIRFALTIAGLVIAVGPFTSAHMNPARTLAPALLNNYWKNHWVFWVGPFTGSILAALLYNILFSVDK